MIATRTSFTARKEMSYFRDRAYAQRALARVI
jgi:hypothetical protein